MRRMYTDNQIVKICDEEIEKLVDPTFAHYIQMVGTAGGALSTDIYFTVITDSEDELDTQDKIYDALGQAKIAGSGHVGNDEVVIGVQSSLVGTTKKIRGIYTTGEPIEWDSTPTITDHVV